MRYILGIDQGTTGSTALLVDEKGQVLARGYREIRQGYPHPAWVEHDPEEIWQSVLVAAEQAVRTAGASFCDVYAIGITNQRETTIAWDMRSGKALHPAIVWQCRRTAPLCDALRRDGAEPTVRARTGLTLDAYFSGTKVRWLVDNAPAVARAVEAGQAAFGTVDSWLLYKMTGGAVHATDPTNASRTMLYNIREGRWDEEVMHLLGIPREVRLPDVKPSGSLFGNTAPAAFHGISVPVAAILGDQQAALFGQGCWDAGSVKVTFGTGAFLLLNVGPKPLEPPAGLLLTLASDAHGKACYALEGSVFIAGAAIQWLRDELRIIDKAAETEALARSLPSTEGVYFVPAFVGLGAPYWDQGARGAIVGLTRGSGRAHLARAALEAIAYQTRDVLDVMVDGTGLALSELRVDGGAAANDFLCELVAGITGVPVNRPVSIETTGLGASYLAGAVTGVYDTKDLASLRRTERVVPPAMDAAQRAALYAGWHDAVSRVRSH